LPWKEAAQEMGVDPGTLARWEHGEKEPTGAFLNRLRLFLGPQDNAAINPTSRRLDSGCAAGSRSA